MIVNKNNSYLVSYLESVEFNSIFNDTTDSLAEGIAEDIQTWLEDLEDNIKLAYKKDKQSIVRKYNEIAKTIVDYSDAIKKLEKIGKTENGKIAILKQYEYYDIYVPAGNVTVQMHYSRSAKFMNAILDIDKVVKTLEPLDNKGRKKFYKNIYNKYNTLYINFEWAREQKKGNVYDCAKYTSDLIQQIKKNVNIWTTQTEKQIQALDKAMDKIRALKLEKSDILKWVKKIVTIFKIAYQHDIGMTVSACRMARKQSNILRKFIVKVEKNMGVSVLGESTEIISLDDLIDSSISTTAYSF